MSIITAAAAAAAAAESQAFFDVFWHFLIFLFLTFPHN